MVKTYYFIDIIELYYRSLQQIYSTVTTEIPKNKNNLALQVFFKTINSLMRLNRLVPDLLVLVAYFKRIK